MSREEPPPVPTTPSSRRRAGRTAGLYLALVLVPAAGVAVALQIGSGLEAPPSVGGRWRVVAAECDRAEGVLTVAQSGRRVDAVYAPAGRKPMAINGTLRGDTLVLAGAEDGCDHLRALVPAGVATRLQATVQAGACGCRPTEATLERQVAPARSTH